MIDTCVYLDVLQGRDPAELEKLLAARIVNHSAIAVAELTHLYGRLDPDHPGTHEVLGPISAALDAIPGHRLTAPATRVLAEAGMLAGLAGRMMRRPQTQRLLNDCALFLHARELGCTLVTANLSDFDILDQLLPGSPPLFYRAKSLSSPSAARPARPG